MFKIRVSATFAVTLLFLTASALAQKSKPAQADYFPLRVGGSWTYRTTEGDTEHSLKVTSEEKQADGTTRYEVEMVSGVKILTSYSKTGDWVLMHLQRYPEHEGMVAKYEPARQHLPNPLRAGLRWEWKGRDPTQTEVTEKSQVIGFENVTVPAGKFRAMKVVSEITGGAAHMTRTYWYAEGVGLVKSSTDGGQIKYGFELIDYSFKKKSGK
jgi:hypothetical protein